MGGAYRSLEWLSRRRDGESMALIAWRDGVSPETVKRATAPYGPFPAASRHLGRTITASTALDERTQRWVDARRRGERVSDIARRDGVAHQLVSRYTAEAGPFPAEVVVQEWVHARQAGQTIAAIATTYAAPEGLVSRAPDFVVGKGRPLWLTTTIARWLEDAGLETCSSCGARCVSVNQHRTAVHQAHGHSPR